MLSNTIFAFKTHAVFSVSIPGLFKQTYCMCYACLIETCHRLLAYNVKRSHMTHTGQLTGIPYYLGFQHIAVDLFC